MKFIEEGFLERNKKVLIISIIIMFLSIVLGGVISYSVSGNEGLVTESFKNISANKTSDHNDTISKVTALGLFTHNLIADMVVMLCGLFFSFISVILVLYNGIGIGIPFGSDFTYACTSILPHGIIEYLALAVSLAIAFNITKIEIKVIKKRKIKNLFKDYKTELKDILVLFFVVIILLLVAAIIESHITPWIVINYYGL